MILVKQRNYSLNFEEDTIYSNKKENKKIK
jgi:hypothetical protein